MKLFTLDENVITAYASTEEVPTGPGIQRFASERELAQISQHWSTDRLAEVWNNFAGAPPFGTLKSVRKFKDRKTAVSRIWKAIQVLEPTPAVTATKRPKKSDMPPSAARDGSKKAIVLERIRREHGATIQELMAATDWQPHSVRGFISGQITKKMGLTVTVIKRESGERAYTLAVA